MHDNGDEHFPYISAMCSYFQVIFHGGPTTKSAQSMLINVNLIFLSCFVTPEIDTTYLIIYLILHRLTC